MTQKFRLHVVSLAHTQTTKAYSNCAYTEKVRKFCNMMKSLGHTVYLYASEENEAECDELITCITKDEQRDFANVSGPHEVLNAPFDVTKPHWQIMNYRVVNEMRERIQPKDIICVIAGGCQKPIADAFPENFSVEFGIGYTGVFSNFRVWESYAWMHTVYGWYYGMPASTQGKFYDRVIPNYYDPDDFPWSDVVEDYYLFVGRLNEDKGVLIAGQVCEKLGAKLIVAGQGSVIPHNAEYRGIIGPVERGELMSRAKAVFVPTLYLEPFGGVNVEAQLCGTPVITTDWGIFSESVEQGKTGYRCRTFAQFLKAAKDVEGLDRAYIRERAISKYSMDNVRHEYQAYFEDLMDLYGDGWYQLHEDD